MAASFEAPQKNTGGSRAINPELAGMLLTEEEENNRDRFVRARKLGEGVPVAQDLKKKEENASRESSLM